MGEAGVRLVELWLRNLLVLDLLLFCQIIEVQLRVPMFIPLCSPSKLASAWGDRIL